MSGAQTSTWHEEQERQFFNLSTNEEFYPNKLGVRLFQVSPWNKKDGNGWCWAGSLDDFEKIRFKVVEEFETLLGAQKQRGAKEAFQELLEACQMLNHLLVPNDNGSLELWQHALAVSQTKGSQLYAVITQDGVWIGEAKSKLVLEGYIKDAEYGDHPIISDGKTSWHRQVERSLGVDLGANEFELSALYKVESHRSPGSFWEYRIQHDNYDEEEPEKQKKNPVARWEVHHELVELARWPKVLARVQWLKKGENVAFHELLKDVKLSQEVASYLETSLNLSTNKPRKRS